jgi:hypothetical protein
MTVSFTICANNYLAHAKTLAISFKKNHPDIPFIIAIVDEPNATINYEDLGADEVLWASDLLLNLIKELKDTYGIAELCTVVKPELFKYLYRNHECVLYIDPDIKVFSKFDEIFIALKDYDMILTPHICSPTGDVGHPQDKDLMRTGIYNLGFLAMKKTKKTLAFLNWWDKRVKAYGFHDLSKGYFYDQIWLGYAPAFLDNVFVIRHLGYNMANWNLHERKLIEKNSKYYVNDSTTKLCFFHFSHFKMESLPILASYNKNFNLNNRPDLKSIYLEYQSDLLVNGYNDLKNIEYTYGKKEQIKNELSFKDKIKQSKLYRALALQKKVFLMLFKSSN